MATTWLTGAPSLPSVYARALRRSRRPPGDSLPNTRLGLHVVDPGRERLASYDRVCGFALSDRLPPTWPHVLGFPLQVELMSRADFPFALPGLVHLRNAVTWERPVAAGETLTVEVQAERLAPHQRGATVDLVTDVSSAGAPVWSGRSTYLARGAAAPPGEPAPDLDIDVDGRPVAQWHVRGDTGRRYAAVSGDVNPIHLAPLAAKAFGFPRAIAHGMWLQARVLASFGPDLPDAGRCDVAFRRPVLLPSTVDVHERAAGTGGWDVELRSGKDRVHLAATIRPA